MSTSTHDETVRPTGCEPAQVLASLADAFARRSMDETATMVRELATDPLVLAELDRVERRLGTVGDAFSLDELETAVLRWTVLPLLDRSYATMYQNLGAGPQLHWWLLYELLNTGPTDGSLAAALSPAGHILRHDLAHVTGWAASGSITISTAVLRYVLGDDSADDNVVRRTVEPVQYVGATSIAVAELIDRGSHMINLVGTEQHATTASAAAAVAGAMSAALVLDVSQDQDPGTISTVIRSALLHATLHRQGLILDFGDRSVPEDTELRHRITDSRIPVVVVSHDDWETGHDHRVMRIRATSLPRDEREAIWHDLLDRAGFATDAGEARGWDSTLARHRLGPQAAAEVIGERLRRGGPAPATLHDLDTVAAARSRTAASHVTTPRRVRQADLVLPPDVEDTLHDAIHRYRMLADPATSPLHDQARGVSLLLSGPPGTGKTSTVHAIANELDLPLMAIGLNTVIDKYIGETERKLERIFAAAEAEPCVLLFDEADALFGSRSAVSDAKDRFANQQVSYLLQRIEEFSGLVCLATNYAGNIDKAFTRRIDYIATLRAPDEAARAMIWRAQLATHDLAHHAAELAVRHETTPAEILNAVTTARVRANRLGVEVDLDAIEFGIQREFAKTGRRTSTSRRSDS